MRYSPKKTLETWWLVIDLYRIVGKAVLYSGLEHWYIGSLWDSYSSWFRGRNSSMGEVVVANATPIWVGEAGNRVSYGRALLLDFLLFFLG